MSVKSGTSASKQKTPPKHLDNPFAIKWSDEGGSKFIGAYIPQEDSEFLALLALFKEASASDLIRQAVQDFIQKNIDAGESEAVIIKEMVVRAFDGWENQVRANNGDYGWRDRIDLNIKFEQYQQEVNKLLKKRKIPKHIITTIQKKLQLTYEGH